MVADVLELVRVDLPAPLATTGSVDALAAVAALMPGFPTVGFECRLGARAGSLDLQIATQRTDLGATSRSLARAHARGGLSPVWERVHGVCREWSTPRTLLHDGLAELWCEIDVEPSRGATALSDVVPSVFAVLDPAVRVDGRALATRVLEHLLDEAQRNALQAVLDCCAAECRGRARLSHIGVMLGRPVAAMRLHVSDLALAQVPSYLADVGWRGDVDRAWTTARLLLDHADRMVLCLDVVGDRLLPRLGVECFFDQKVGIDPRWPALLDGLVDAGLATSQKAAALARWPGVVTPADEGVRWPDGLIVPSLTQPADKLGVVERRLSHVKLAFDPDEATTAKAYFGAGHVWWRAGVVADRTSRTPRCPRPGRRRCTRPGRWMTRSTRRRRSCSPRATRPDGGVTSSTAVAPPTSSAAWWDTPATNGSARTSAW